MKSSSKKLYDLQKVTAGQRHSPERRPLLSSFSHQTYKPPNWWHHKQALRTVGQFELIAASENLAIVLPLPKAYSDPSFRVCVGERFALAFTSSSANQ